MLYKDNLEEAARQFIKGHPEEVDELYDMLIKGRNVDIKMQLNKISYLLNIHTAINIIDYGYIDEAANMVKNIIIDEYMTEAERVIIKI